jgi:hypothetical protein
LRLSVNTASTRKFLGLERIASPRPVGGARVLTGRWPLL